MIRRYLAAIAVTVMAVPSLAIAQHVILVANDLGMHCMNRDHANMSILPPWNTLQAQVVLRGDEGTPPQLITEGVTLEYSIPGNTYSVGKTDFWDWDLELFGVDLPPNIGLTGKGLDDVFDLHDDLWIAEGVPLTPFPDATPTTEVPYQQALVILRDALGDELARARPVMPVSTEINCVTSGCHVSETAILAGHDDDGGFDPNATPILCASCHGSTPLTGPDPGPHDWFSKRIHEKHSFLDETVGGLAACQLCHPGPQAQCLRGTMGNDYGMICQDCHGDLEEVSGSIDDGRVPWVDEPACRTCHTAAYGEPVGQLYRNSRGHGGLLCTACHNSPHAIFPSREDVDNDVMVDLQGHSGSLSDCTVCHGHVPSGPGPHGMTVTAAAMEQEILGDFASLRVFPSPAQVGAGCTIEAAAARSANGRLLVFDVRGRTVRHLRAETDDSGHVSLAWDGRDGNGRDVASGTYFLRWDDGTQQASTKVVMVR